MVKKSDKKGAIWFDELGGWIIAIVVLVVMLLGFLIISGKLNGALEYIQNLFRFGR
ncbi:MAG: hypothetical protein ACE5ES_03815 [Candidatus Nanoarchaeia archaeon]